jgi:hypothetical protein
MVKVNVDNLKLIQVGITLSDINGRVPPGVCSWQFNMFFDIRYDLFKVRMLMNFIVLNFMPKSLWTC